MRRVWTPLDLAAMRVDVGHCRPCYTTRRETVGCDMLPDEPTNRLRCPRCGWRGSPSDVLSYEVN